jgi:uncharacterized protein YjbJ (UPF0337 family)
MSSESRDRVEGKVDELKGRGKSAAGELTGDKETQARGEADQAMGKAKQGMADVKDKVSDIADRLKKDDNKQ